MTAGENIYYGGLLRYDMSEKPVYIRLKKLIRDEWHTDTAVKAENGTARFRGFCGEYDLRVYAAGKKIPASLNLSKDGDNTLTVRIPV